MMLMNENKKIYFLAICGTAMASCAAMLKQKGYDVYGSDENLYPPMSTFLEDQNIPVMQGFDPAHLDPQPDLVVVGNVISRGNVEIEEILDKKIPYISLASALREFMIRGNRSFVVTGTHGKTTTSSMLAWVFESAGKDPGFMIGGIPENFGRGFQLGSGGDFILEGDEYDSAFFEKTAKFLQYLPDVGIINSVEFDHADIYKSLDDIKLAFKRFVNLVPRSGLLIVCGDDSESMDVSAKAFCPVETFGLNDENDWRAEKLQVSEGLMHFDVYHHNALLGNVALGALGKHNVKNALAVIAAANSAGITFEKIQQALKTFKGVKRRLELKGEAAGVEVYDDFGHHPTAIKETLDGFRLKYPDSGIWALFEPRSATTRRNIFQKEFIEVFDSADYVLLSPVNQPSKVGNDTLFSPELLAEDIRCKGKTAHYIETTDEMVKHIIKHVKRGDKVVTFSNGPFDKIHEKLIAALKNNS